MYNRLIFLLLILIALASDNKEKEIEVLQVVEEIPVAVRQTYDPKVFEQRAIHVSRGSLDRQTSNIETYIKSYIEKHNKKEAELIAQCTLKYASKYKLDPLLILSVIECETRGDKFNSRLVGSSKDTGLMQVIPPTGKWIASQLGMKYNYDMLFDIDTNINMGAWLLSWTHAFMKSKGVSDGKLTEMTLVGYNAGPSKALSWMSDKKGYAKIVNKFYSMHKDNAPR